MESVEAKKKLKKKLDKVEPSNNTLAVKNGKGGKKPLEMKRDSAKHTKECRDMEMHRGPPSC